MATKQEKEFELTGFEPKETEQQVEAQKEAAGVVVPEKQPLPKEQEAPKPSFTPVAPAKTAVPVDPVLKKIEGILEENLGEVYASLPAEVKPKFKAKGEEVALKIKEMLDRAKLKTRKILKLIRKWLKIIPGVNRFFLEQEAALKAQKIIAMKEEEKNK